MPPSLASRHGGALLTGFSNRMMNLLADKYLMVVGELQQTGQEPVIKVMKIQDLSTNAIAEGMWKVEVMDLYRYT